MSTYRTLFANGEFRALFGGQAIVAGQTMQMLALSAPKRFMCPTPALTLACCSLRQPSACSPATS
jgi:hypothetical protein